MVQAGECRFDMRNHPIVSENILVTPYISSAFKERNLFFLLIKVLISVFDFIYKFFTYKFFGWELRLRRTKVLDYLQEADLLELNFSTI